MFNSINDWAPVFDADRRAVTPSKGLSALKNVGAQLNAYGLHANDVLTFPDGMTADNIEIGIQAPRREGQRPSFLVPCLINGVQTYINPMFFLRNKRENDRNAPVYPNWAKLGDAEAVVKQLLKQGGIVAGAEMQVPMADFEQDGSAKYVPRVDAAGNKVLKADGSIDMVRATVNRPYPELPDPVQ